MNLHRAAQCAAVFLIADVPFMFHSAPGIGKSDVMRALARALKYDYLIDKRASQMEPVDTIGVPSVVNGRTTWNPPDWLPSEATHGGLRGLNYFDELPDSAIATQSALYQWILDRNMAGIQAPAGLRMAAAGNRQSDRAAAKRMSTALANRFAHIPIESDVATFVDYAENGGEIVIRPDVLAFVPTIGIPAALVAFHKWCESRGVEMLHNMTAAELLAFPTPRSWAQLAKIMSAPADLLPDLFTALVGSAASSELIGFLKIYGHLPALSAVWADPIGSHAPAEISARYAMACAIARNVTAATMTAAVTYLQRLTAGFAVMAITDAVKRDPSLKATQGYVQWSLANQDSKL